MKYSEVIKVVGEDLLSSLFLCKVRASVMGGSVALFRVALQLKHASNELLKARSVNTVKLIVLCAGLFGNPTKGIPGHPWLVLQWPCAVRLCFLECLKSGTRRSHGSVQIATSALKC